MRLAFASHIASAACRKSFAATRVEAVEAVERLREMVARDAGAR